MSWTGHLAVCTAIVFESVVTGRSLSVVIHGRCATCTLSRIGSRSGNLAINAILFGAGLKGLGPFCEGLASRTSICQEKAQRSTDNPENPSRGFPILHAFWKTLRTETLELENSFRSV